MKKFIILFIIWAGNLFSQNIIPQPQDYIPQQGSFLLNADTKIIYNEGNIKDEAEWFAGYIQQASSFALPVENIPSPGFKRNTITLVYEILQSSELPPEESYKLVVTDSNVIISAQGEAGIFYGLQTLRQMLSPDFEYKGPVDKMIDRNIPACIIYDYPAFKWRGMLLDCCRHFMSKEFILRYLDLLALHKMNRFHWHLTEDQGWRIEIKKYPKLTEIGAFRKEKDGRMYGGFYTQEDIKEVIAYAKKLHILVVPEIEMPGHSLAALASYPELSCTGGPHEVTNQWGVFEDVYCAGNEKTFEFLQDVLDEVITLFPSKYIHIGGDEVPKTRWEKCNKCNARLESENLKNYEELQSYFTKRIDKYLESKGKILIGWDEILEGGLSPNAIVQSWRGFEGGLKAAREKHFVIMSPTSHCYFDYSLDKINLKKVYSFDPIPEGMTDYESTFILGGECNMWTERAPQELVDSKLFPRILALSEVLWRYPVNRDYDKFLERVRNHYKRLEILGVKYGGE